jgi:hypothetical protein
MKQGDLIASIIAAGETPSKHVIEIDALLPQFETMSRERGRALRRTWPLPAKPFCGASAAGTCDDLVIDEMRSAVGQVGAVRLNDLRGLDIRHENAISFEAK